MPFLNDCIDLLKALKATVYTDRQSVRQTDPVKRNMKKYLENLSSRQMPSGASRSRKRERERERESGSEYKRNIEGIQTARQTGRRI